MLNSSCENGESAVVNFAELHNSAFEYHNADYYGKAADYNDYNNDYDYDYQNTADNNHNNYQKATAQSAYACKSAVFR